MEYEPWHDFTLLQHYECDYCVYVDYPDRGDYPVCR